MHSCEICGRRYRSNLSMHYRIRTTRNAYICKVCQNDFNRRSILNKKQQFQTEENHFSCDIRKSKLKYMPNFVCDEQIFLAGYDISGIDPMLSFESEDVNGRLGKDITPVKNGDCKLPSLEDYILPTKPTESENIFPNECTGTSKLESTFSLSSVKSEKISRISSHETDREDGLATNLNINEIPVPVHVFNTPIISSNNSVGSMSILESLLTRTRPVTNIHEKHSPTSLNNEEFQVPTIPSESLLRNLLVNQENKNFIARTSILESLLTKPAKNDQKKCSPLSLHTPEIEDTSISSSLLKSLLLASKTHELNETNHIPSSQGGKFSASTVISPDAVSIPVENGKSMSLVNTARNIDSKTPTKNLFKIVNVVSLAGDLQMSNASTTNKTNF